MAETRKKCQVVEGHPKDGSLSIYLESKFPKYNEDIIIKKCDKEGKEYKRGIYKGVILCSTHKALLDFDPGGEILGERDKFLNTIGEYIERQYPNNEWAERYLKQMKEMTTEELEEFEKELTALWTLEQVIFSKHLK